jgi:hypothetical protein
MDTGTFVSIICLVLFFILPMVYICFDLLLQICLKFWYSNIPVQLPIQNELVIPVDDTDTIVNIEV